MAPVPDLERLAKEYGKYAVDAYVFVQEGLRHAAEHAGKIKDTGKPQHLTALELVDGVLRLAADRYGLLAINVLRNWGLYRSEDVGAVTFQLIDCGIFGKRPSDRLEDFAHGPAFADRLEELTRVRLALDGAGA